jgi:hypothetical protein
MLVYINDRLLVYLMTPFQLHCKWWIGTVAEGTGCELYYSRADLRIPSCRGEIRMLSLPDTKREYQQLRCSVILFWIWNGGLTKTRDKNIRIYFNWDHCSLLDVIMALLMGDRHVCLKVKLVLYSVIIGLLPWMYWNSCENSTWIAFDVTVTYIHVYCIGGVRHLLLKVSFTKIKRTKLIDNTATWITDTSIISLKLWPWFGRLCTHIIFYCILQITSHLLIAAIYNLLQVHSAW